MEQKFLNILVVVLLVGIIGVSSVAVIQQMSYQNLDSQYQELLTDYETLSSEWNQTSDDLNDLQSEFETMQTAYLTLIDDYASLSEIHLIVLSNNTDLQQSLDDLQELYDQLLADFLSLNTSFAELSESYADLQADYAQLQLDYDELQANYNQLLFDHIALVVQYQALQDSYNALVLAYDTLEQQYIVLVLDYDTLLSGYNTLVGDYLALQSDYDALELSYNTLMAWIKWMILPMQFGVFAEAVRRYYLPEYISATNVYSGFAEFCRDVVVHDLFKYQYNAFSVVSNALSDAFKYGNKTWQLAVNALADISQAASNMGEPYLITLAGFAVLVKRHVDPKTAYLRTMGGIVVEELGIDKAKLGKDDKYRVSVMQRIMKEIPAKFIDARCFGAAITLENASYSHVGPVQFAIGRSLNKPDVKSFTITTTFASDEKKTAGTFGEFHVVDYSLILFHGIASEYTAKDSGMAEGDLLHLYRGLWQGTKMLNTRSKFNHVPRFLISVVSKKDHFQIGGLDRFVKLTVEDGIKKVTDALVDITGLVDILKTNAGNIERIEILSDMSLRFKYDKEESSDLVSLLAKTGLSVKTLELR